MEIEEEGEESTFPLMLDERETGVSPSLHLVDGHEANSFNYDFPDSRHPT